jgi:hypothetical protein
MIPDIFIFVGCMWCLTFLGFGLSVLFPGDDHCHCPTCQPFAYITAVLLIVSALTSAVAIVFEIGFQLWGAL